MIIFISVLLTALAALAALPACILCIQCVVAALPFRDPAARANGRRPSLGVLVPAHDEEAVIEKTLTSIQAQLVPGDRLLVIADNCSDSTARIADSLGAEVLERFDPVRRGKGFALQAGIERFQKNPPAPAPDVVIVIDADCQLEPGCLDALAAQVGSTSRPVQACYVMAPPDAPRAIDVISSLAVLVKNRVRPLAMARLGFPCLITGSGSAFPWRALETRSFAGSNIVEDMQLSVDLALAGAPPTYCDRAVVRATLPDRHSAFVSQRRRWEHGHLQTLLGQTPRLLFGFFTTGRPALLAMMLDLAVPPLSLLAIANSVLLAAALLFGAVSDNWSPAAIAAGGTCLLSAAVATAWWRFARDQIPFRSLLAVPVYVATKVPLYVTFLFRREQTWVRTARSARDS